MKIINRVLKILFHACFVRPIVLLVLGLNIRNRNLLPEDGPAILIGNHNSHLDTVVLMSIFNLLSLKKIKAVAAADYFLRNKLIGWFALEIIGIIPLERKGAKDKSVDEKLASIYDALDEGTIVILFPEGSRGEPEKMSDLKSGVARISEKYPRVPVYPIFMYGLGKALPKGESMLVPFHLDVFISEPITWTGERTKFMTEIQNAYDHADKEIYRPEWT